MITAAAEVNPLITGLERKFTRNPIRKSPSSSCMVPTMKVSRIARAMYSSTPLTANTPRPAATKRESIATGPMANCLEVPSKL